MRCYDKIDCLPQHLSACLMESFTAAMSVLTKIRHALTIGNCEGMDNMYFAVPAEALSVEASAASQERACAHMQTRAESSNSPCNFVMNNPSNVMLEKWGMGEQKRPFPGHFSLEVLIMMASDWQMCMNSISLLQVAAWTAAVNNTATVLSPA